LRFKALRAGGGLARQNYGGQAPGVLHHVMGAQSLFIYALFFFIERLVAAIIF